MAKYITAFVCLIIASYCFAGQTLFYRISSPYGREGRDGEAFQQQFEPRMFPHAQWHERLFISTYEPDVDDTLETYSRPDGSRWLNHRRAIPSLSRIVGPSVSGERYDMKKELAAVRITSREVALPAHVAQELELLWRKMLPGLPSEPNESSRTHTYYVHPPALVASAKENQSVKSGRIVTAAIETSTYRAFADIVDDLMKVCDRGGGANDTIFAALPGKMARLRKRL